MNIKFLIPAFISFLVILSCENAGKTTTAQPDTEFPPTAREIPRSESSTDADHEIDSMSRHSKTEVESEDQPNQPLGGSYIKIGEESDSNCNCYCLEVKFTSNAELCLQADSLYISARFEKAKNNTINVFFVELSRESQRGDIPWEDFDTNFPVAIITSKADGVMELDWLGFTINGDIVMDYALLGKKSLEGTYKQN